MPIMRSPADTVDKIKDYIQDKVFCDIGCGSGIVIKCAMKYAKRAFGIERNPVAVRKAREAGCEVFEMDIDKNIPEADVYYSWIRHQANRELFNKLQKEKPGKILIIGAEKFVKEECDFLFELAYFHKTKIIEWNYNEGNGHRESGTFYLGIFKL